MVLKMEWLMLLWGLATVSADITVYFRSNHHELNIEFRDMPARFGGSIPSEGIQAFVVYANPPDGCGPMEMAPNMSVPDFPVPRWAVLMRRYGCNFEEKVRNAQAAQFDVAIVHNVNSSVLEPMSANNKLGIKIVAVFVSEYTGILLQEKYTYDNGFYIMVDDESPFDINTNLLWPFALVVGLCFCTMLSFMVAKCIKDYRRNRRHRLPSSSLRKIPIAKFRKGDPYETCAICLEDFVEEEKLRILPCSHAYHCKCVDPWLTRNRRVCPICKRKVFAADETRPDHSDSDSDSEADDRTPLLRPTHITPTQGGTFPVAPPLPLMDQVNELRRALLRAEAGMSGPSNSAPSIQDQDDNITFTTTTNVVSPVEAPNPFAEI